MKTNKTVTAPAPSVYPAAQARIAAGFPTIEAAAERLRVQPRYLRNIEKKGRAPLVFAERASLLYKCPIGLFLFSPESLARTGAMGSPSESGAPEAANAVASAMPKRSRFRRSPALTLIKGR